MPDLWSAEAIYFGIRVVATFVGVIIGWYATAPVAATAYRIIVRAAIPGWSMAFARMIGSVLTGVLVFHFLPLGGNGFGWGGGSGPGGGGPGPGGQGKGNGVAIEAPKDPKIKTGSSGTEPAVSKDVLSIELLGGKRYKGDEKFYLIDRKEPAVKLSEVDEFLKANSKKYTTVLIIVTGESVDESTGAYTSLLKLTYEKHKLPTRLDEPK